MSETTEGRMQTGGTGMRVRRRSRGWPTSERPMHSPISYNQTEPLPSHSPLASLQPLRGWPR